MRDLLNTLRGVSPSVRGAGREGGERERGERSDKSSIMGGTREDRGRALMEDERERERERERKGRGDVVTCTDILSLSHLSSLTD